MANKFLKNLQFVLIAQIIVFALGITKSILLPKFWSVEAFGYWQLYLFYCSYLGLFALGFNDGIYLRYGKYSYEELPHARIRGAMRYYALMLLGFTALVGALTLLEKNPERSFVFHCVCLNILLVCLNAVFLFVLQITNQFKKYSIFSFVDKLVLLLAILFFMLMDKRNYRLVIYGDLIAKLAVVLAMGYSCKELVWGQAVSRESCWREFKTDIRIGIKLLFANLMGMLILGVGRIFVEYGCSIEDYAYYSFGISATNLVFIFITAVSLVLYPSLKRLDRDHYDLYYLNSEKIIRLFNNLVLLGYFPAYWFIEKYLPHYTPVFAVLNILFALIILQCKSSLLHNTFFNATREEKTMLKLNIGCVILFLLGCGIPFYFQPKIQVVAWSSLVIMLFRVWFADCFFSRKFTLSVNMGKKFECVILLLAFLMITSCVHSPILSGIGYGGCILIYLLFNRKDIVVLKGVLHER